LITSLISSLLLHLSILTPSDLADDESEGRRLAHNLSQYVHCLAQGKVGSGFDVSAAVFGSHIYTRFDPIVLQQLMTDDAVSHSIARDHPLMNLPVQVSALTPHHLSVK
jgi:phosphomevalonate kinase